MMNTRNRHPLMLLSFLLIPITFFSFRPILLKSLTNLPKSDSQMSLFQDDTYGYGFFYPSELTLKEQWDSGVSHIVEFSSENTDFSKFYIVIENFDPTYNSIEEWLNEREPNFMGTVKSTSQVILDGVPGIQRIYYTEDTYHLAQYYLTNNKIYLLNVGPLSEPILPESFIQIVNGNFHWLKGNYVEPVPTLPQNNSIISDTQPAMSPPTLQFPFCGTWLID